MNKKEVSEIKKQFKYDNTSIDRIAGYYVNTEGNVVDSFNKAFLSLSEDEAALWLNLFKKGFGGKVSSREFSSEQEKDGGVQSTLMSIRDSALQDKDVNDDFFKKLAASDEAPRNRLYVMLHCNYDIINKVKQESEDVFNFVMGFIIPIELCKPNLCYNPDKKNFEEKSRSWDFKAAEFSFIFPSFEDREPDIHTVTYCVKKNEEYYIPFVMDMFGIENIVTADVQKSAFSNALTKALESEDISSDAKLELIRTIQSDVEAAVDEHDANNYALDMHELGNLFVESGMTKRAAERFGEVYRDESGIETLTLSNIVAQNINVNVRDTKLVAKDTVADKVGIKEIDGIKCLVVPVDEGGGSVEVNGITIK